MGFLIRLLRIPLNWWRWAAGTLPYSDCQSAEVYIALTFGMGPHQTPGCSNEQIAQVLVRLYQNHPRPIIAQKEVYEALRIHQVVQPAHLICIPGPEEQRQAHIHRHSADSVDDALTFCRTFGWQRGVLVGHRRHMPRVLGCFQRRGFAISHVETAGITYCPNSVQRWCRGPIRFCIWEVGLAIPAYTLLGKM